MPTLATRVISGKGVLKLDTATTDYKKAKVFTVYVDVIRPPNNEYINYAYNPPRSRYATLNFFRGNYLVHSYPLEFPAQSWDFYLDPAAQALYAVECSYAGILQTFVNLGVALGVTPTSVVNQIQNWNHVRLSFDSIKVVCYADTAVKMTVTTNNFDLCTDQQNKTPDPPPPPPPTPTKYPKKSPLANTSDPASPPYSGTDDGGDTVPYPGDLYVPPPPPARTCIQRTVVVKIYESGQTPYNLTNPFFGNIGQVIVAPDGTSVKLECYGAPWAGTGQCTQSVTQIGIVGGTQVGRYTKAEIVSITPAQ